MIIRDLEVLEVVSEKNKVKGGYAFGNTYAYASAFGTSFATTLTNTFTSAYSNYVYISK